MSDALRETRQVTAYVSLYDVTRQYGGPEEGGWYYDSYEWLKVSMPFRALQEYRYIDTDDHVMMPGYWEAVGQPRPADHRAEVQVESFMHHLSEMYDLHGRDRYRAYGGDDTEAVIERNPGELGERPRPRYE